MFSTPYRAASRADMSEPEVAALLVGAGPELVSAMYNPYAWGNDAARCARSLRTYADTGRLHDV
jgi:hypothetical protein